MSDDGPGTSATRAVASSIREVERVAVDLHADESVFSSDKYTLVAQLHSRPLVNVSGPSRGVAECWGWPGGVPSPAAVRRQEGLGVRLLWLVEAGGGPSGFDDPSPVHDGAAVALPYLTPSVERFARPPGAAVAGLAYARSRRPRLPTEFTAQRLRGASASKAQMRCGGVLPLCGGTPASRRPDCRPGLRRAFGSAGS